MSSGQLDLTCFMKFQGRPEFDEAARADLQTSSRDFYEQEDIFEVIRERTASCTIHTSPLTLWSIL